MHRKAIIDDLLSAARQSDDSAIAIDAATAVLLPLYCAALDVKTAESHSRAMELYCHAIENPRQARRLRKEAETFRAAAELIAQGIAARSDETPQEARPAGQEPGRPTADAPHICPRCSQPNPDLMDMDGCRDPDCPENGEDR